MKSPADSKGGAFGRRRPFRARNQAAREPDPARHPRAAPLFRPATPVRRGFLPDARAHASEDARTDCRISFFISPPAIQLPPKLPSFTQCSFLRTKHPCAFPANQPTVYFQTHECPAHSCKKLPARVYSYIICSVKHAAPTDERVEGRAGRSDTWILKSSCPR